MSSGSWDIDVTFTSEDIGRRVIMGHTFKYNWWVTLKQFAYSKIWKYSFVSLVCRNITTIRWMTSEEFVLLSLLFYWKCQENFQVRKFQELSRNQGEINLVQTQTVPEIWGKTERRKKDASLLGPLMNVRKSSTGRQMEWGHNVDRNWKGGGTM